MALAANASENGIPDLGDLTALSGLGCNILRIWCGYKSSISALDRAVTIRVQSCFCLSIFTNLSVWSLVSPVNGSSRMSVLAEPASARINLSRCLSVTRSALTRQSYLLYNPKVKSMR